MASYKPSQFMRIKSKGWICDMTFYWSHLEFDYEELEKFPLSKNDYTNIHTAFGIIRKYRYSDWILFDSADERDTFRNKLQAERAASAYRNKMIRALTEEFKSQLENKSTEELERIMKRIFK